MFTSSENSARATFDAETDRDDADVAEVSLTWGDSTLAVRHLVDGETLRFVGQSGVLMLADESSVDSSLEIACRQGAVHVELTPRDGALVSLDGVPRDAAPFTFGAGHHAEIVVGQFAVHSRLVPAGKAVPLTWAERLREARFGGLALSTLFHASLVASLAFFVPSLAHGDEEAIDRDQILRMRAMLDAAAAREEEQREAALDPSAANEGADSGGGRAKNPEGAMGTPMAAPHAHGHYAARGDARPEDVTLSKREMLEQAKSMGMNALIGKLASSMENDGPTVPWDSVLNGMDKQSVAGDLWSTDIGTAFGSGLGFSGTDIGGGGDNIGIGMNDVGGLRRSLAARGDGSCLSGPCGGVAVGILGHGHVPSGPRMRVADTHVEGGQLPADVIQRIVRLSHGRFRNCYEAGLRDNPSLAGRVAVRFVIDRQGGVSLASDAGSDLPNESVRACVVKSFYALSFPAPTNGTVRVTYPLSFSPG